MLVDIPQPLGDVVKALRVGYVIHEEDAIGAPVVTGGDRVETLLTSRVPDLQFDFLALELDSFNLEINPNCRDESRVECVIGKSILIL